MPSANGTSGPRRLRSAQAEELLAQRGLEHLRRRLGTRERVDEADMTGLLEAGQPVAAVGDDGVGVEGSAVLEHDRGQRHLAPAVVGDADDRALAYARELGDVALDLGRQDRLPARADAVPQPAAEAEDALVVGPGQVRGA